MTFREDMFSLLFISLVKPQYRLYCEMAYRTQQAQPYDLHESVQGKKLPSTKVENAEKDDDDDFEKPVSYC